VLGDEAKQLKARGAVKRRGVALKLLLPRLKIVTPGCGECLWDGMPFEF
jgi:hypothetical protein